METKRLNEKLDFPDRITAMFTNKKAYIGDTSYPLGQLTVDVLNLPDDALPTLLSLVKDFLTGSLNQLINPEVEITKELVDETQEQWNRLIDFSMQLPVLRDLRIDVGLLKMMLPKLFSCDPKEFQYIKEPYSKVSEVVDKNINSWIRIPRGLVAFQRHVVAYAMTYAEWLKSHNPEGYAAAYYDFITDKEVQLFFEEGTLNFLSAPSQRHTVNIEFTTMPDPKDPMHYQLAERFEFSSLDAFLHVDFFRGLMAGRAPRRCHNCGKFFLLENGYNICYCTNVAPGETERTCRQVGAHKKSAEKQGKTMAQVEYQKLYNRLKGRKNRKKISEDEWNEQVAWAQEMKEKAEKGEISEWDLKEMFGKV